MQASTALLLKLSGNLFSKGFPGGLSGMHAIIDQIAQLSTQAQLGIVIAAETSSAAPKKS